MPAATSLRMFRTFRVALPRELHSLKRSKTFAKRLSFISKECAMTALRFPRLRAVWIMLKWRLDYCGGASAGHRRGKPGAGRAAHARPTEETSQCSGGSQARATG